MAVDELHVGGVDGDLHLHLLVLLLLLQDKVSTSLVVLERVEDLIVKLPVNYNPIVLFFACNTNIIRNGLEEFLNFSMLDILHSFLPSSPD